MRVRCQLLVLAGVLEISGCHLIIDYKDSEIDKGGTAGVCTPGTVETCYSGPDETLGKGLCVAGERTCMADGMWDTCRDEVTPRPEQCSLAGDEDCNGFACSETLWVRRFGEVTTKAYSGDVAIDPTNGDIYATGSVSGPIVLGNDALDSQGEAPVAFLAKFNRLGVPIWAKQFGKLGGSTIDFEGAVGLSIAVDGERNVVLGGRAWPDIDLGGGSLPGGLFIGKLSPAGETLWGRSCVGDGENAVVGIDPETNDVILAGSYAVSGSGTIDCGGAIHGGTADIFIIRLSAGTGQEMLSASFGAAGLDAVMDMAVDAQGNIHLVGRGEGLSFGGAPPLTGGFVAKLAPNASHVWSTSIGDGLPRALALDSGGGPAITGAGYGVLSFGGGNLDPQGTADLFVAKLDGSGAHVWSKRFGSAGDNAVVGRDIAIDATGDIAVSGDVSGNVPIDGVVIAGNQLTFLAQFGREGTVQWSRSFGRPGKHQLSFWSLDELVVLGQSSDPVDFGTGPVSPLGQPDLFLFKLAQ